MPKRDTRSDRCSFCGTQEADAAKLVQGPEDAAICDACVHLAADVVADAPPAPGQGSSCRLVLEDGAVQDIAHGLQEAVSILGRDDASLVTFNLADDLRLVVRRARCRACGKQSPSRRA